MFSILMKQMMYFEQALKSMNEGDDFDISVHCDIKIFEWLLLYIEFEEKKINPKIKFFDVVNERQADLDRKRVKPEVKIEDAISILISAEYLRIP